METKTRTFMKKFDGTTLICNRIDGITIISNFVRPPIYVHSLNCVLGITHVLLLYQPLLFSQSGFLQRVKNLSYYRKVA